MTREFFSGRVHSFILRLFDAVGLQKGFALFLSFLSVTAVAARGLILTWINLFLFLLACLFVKNATSLALNLN